MSLKSTQKPLGGLAPSGDYMSFMERRHHFTKINRLKSATRPQAKSSRSLRKIQNPRREQTSPDFIGTNETPLSMGTLQTQLPQVGSQLAPQQSVQTLPGTLEIVAENPRVRQGKRFKNTATFSVSQWGMPMEYLEKKK